MEPGEARTRRTEAPVIVLLLPLYLVLLAFFVLLVSHAKVDPVRLGAALGSLKTAFAVLPVPPSMDQPRPLDPVLGRLAEGVGDLLATAIPAGRVSVIPEEGRMEVDLPAADLFEAGSARILPARAALLKGLAAAMASGEDRFELVAALSRTRDGDLSRTRDGAGSPRRAGALAQALVAAGVPAGRVSAAVEGGRRLESGRVRLSFRLLGAGDGGP